MKIEKRKSGNVMRQSINQSIQANEKQLVLNFAEVPYLDSTGLGEVVRSYTTLKKEGGAVKIANLTNKVKDLMMVTKLITVFETFENENDAVKSFK